jgi:hypothetical protein
MRILILVFTLFFSVNNAIAEDDFDALQAAWELAQAAADVAQLAADDAKEEADDAYDDWQDSHNGSSTDEGIEEYYLDYQDALYLAQDTQSAADLAQDHADKISPVDWLGLAQAKFESGQTLTVEEHELVYDSALDDFNAGKSVTALEEQLLIDVYVEEHKEALDAEAVEAAKEGFGDDGVDDDDFVQLAGTVIATMGADAAGDMIDSFAVENASMDQLLSMNTRDDYSVSEHIQQTFDMGCAGFDEVSFIRGVCTWLECKLIYCTINVSAVVEHRVPDLLVEVEGSDKESVIIGMNWVGNSVESVGIVLHKVFGLDIDSIKGSPRGSQNSDKGGKQRDNYNEFDVTVMGNPYLYLYEYAMGTLMDATNILSYCYSNAIPFQPYFTSKTSPEWRFGAFERIASLGDNVSGLWGDTRNINNYGYHFNPEDPAASLDAALGIYWGYIYPRMGMHKHKSVYRSAGVIAQRTGSIISYNNGDDAFPNLHLTSLGEWPPSDTNENNSKSFGVYRVEEHNDKHAWQLNYPQGKRSDGCYRFPDVEWDGADYINGVYPQKKIGEKTVQTGTETHYETVTWKTKSWTGHVTNHSKVVESQVPVYEQQDITEDITSNTQDGIIDEVDMTSDSNSYVWTLWRNYKCCTKRGQVFLFDIQW